MHFISTNLNLKRLTGRTDQSRVQRLVHIRLRHRNVILETSRNRLIHLMDHTKRCITVLHVLHADPDCKQIIYLIQGLILVHHLFVNTEKVFDTAIDLGFDPRISHVRGYFIHNALHKGFSGPLAERDLLRQLIIHIRLQIF